jgi:hypothetical protein
MGLRISQNANYAKFSPVAVTSNLDITATATGSFRTGDRQKRARCECGMLRCWVDLAFLRARKTDKTAVAGSADDFTYLTPKEEAARVLAAL